MHFPVFPFVPGPPKNRVYTPPVRTIRTYDALFGVPAFNRPVHRWTFNVQCWTFDVCTACRLAIQRLCVPSRPLCSILALPSHAIAQIQAHCALMCTGV